MRAASRRTSRSSPTTATRSAPSNSPAATGRRGRSSTGAATTRVCALRTWIVLDDPERFDVLVVEPVQVASAQRSPRPAEHEAHRRRLPPSRGRGLLDQERWPQPGRTLRLEPPAKVDKSLLRHTAGRYWMLETIREYASERLDESGERDELRFR